MAAMETVSVRLSDIVGVSVAVRSRDAVSDCCSDSVTVRVAEADRLKENEGVALGDVDGVATSVSVFFEGEYECVIGSDKETVAVRFALAVPDSGNEAEGDTDSDTETVFVRFCEGVIDTGCDAEAEALSESVVVAVCSSVLPVTETVVVSAAEAVSVAINVYDGVGPLCVAVGGGVSGAVSVLFGSIDSENVFALSVTVRVCVSAIVGLTVVLTVSESETEELSVSDKVLVKLGDEDRDGEAEPLSERDDDEESDEESDSDGEVDTVPVTEGDSDSEWVAVDVCEAELEGVAGGVRVSGGDTVPVGGPTEAEADSEGDGSRDGEDVGSTVSDGPGVSDWGS